MLVIQLFNHELCTFIFLVPLNTYIFTYIFTYIKLQKEVKLFTCIERNQSCRGQSLDTQVCESEQLTLHFGSLVQAV